MHVAIDLGFISNFEKHVQSSEDIGFAGRSFDHINIETCMNVSKTNIASSTVY